MNQLKVNVEMYIFFEEFSEKKTLCAIDILFILCFPGVATLPNLRPICFVLVSWWKFMKEKHIPELGCFVLPSHLVNFSNGAGCFLDFEVGGPKMFFFLRMERQQDA